MRAIVPLKQRGSLGEPIHVWRGMERIAIAAHVRGQQRIDAEKQNVGGPLAVRHAVLLLLYVQDVPVLACQRVR